MIPGSNEIGGTEDFEFAALAEAVNYRKTIIGEFSKFLKGRVLEIGAGIGQTTEALVGSEGVDEVVAVEPDHRFHEGFGKRLPNVRLVKGTSQDVSGEDFDGVITVNVMEHIENDETEFAMQHSLLKGRRGYLCCLVPARPEIFAPLDDHFGHYRRYTKKELRRKLEGAGFKVEEIFYFNFVGYFAWAFRFKLLGKMDFDLGQVRLFDRKIFPVAHSLERKLLRPPIGQSLIAIATPR